MIYVYDFPLAVRYVFGLLVVYLAFREVRIAYTNTVSPPRLHVLRFDKVVMVNGKFIRKR